MRPVISAAMKHRATVKAPAAVESRTAAEDVSSTAVEDVTAATVERRPTTTAVKGRTAVESASTMEASATMKAAPTAVESTTATVATTAAVAAASVATTPTSAGAADLNCQSVRRRLCHWPSTGTHRRHRQRRSAGRAR